MSMLYTSVAPATASAGASHVSLASGHHHKAARGRVRCLQIRIVDLDGRGHVAALTRTKARRLAGMLLAAADAWEAETAEPSEEPIPQPRARGAEGRPTTSAHGRRDDDQPRRPGVPRGRVAP